MKLYQCSWIYHSHLRFRLTLRNIHRWFAKLERAATSVARSTTLPGCGLHHNAYLPETTAGGCGLREADSQLTCSFTKEGLEMLMDNTFELLGITDSNIKITRFSAESVNGSSRNGSKILHTRLTEFHQERFEMELYKQRYLCKECLKTWSARTDIVEEGHTLSHQLKRSILHMAREGITATGIARICHCSPSSVIRIIDEAVELKSRVSRLPENLCFDELRSVNSTMSFICCDAEGSHDIVAILENRLTKTIREHFMNRYTNRERAAVKSVVVDLNARIIIDRFHIVQLVGKALIRSWRWKCFWDSLSEYTSSSRSFRRVRIVMSTATGQSRGARDRGRSAFDLCESTAGIHTWIHASGNAGGVDT